MTRHRLRGMGIQEMKHLVLAVATVSVMACGASPVPTAPGPTTPVSDPPTGSANVQVSGFVWDHGPTGVTLVTSGNVDAFVDMATSGYALGPQPIGPDGRYVVLVPPGARIHVKGNGRQPCAASVEVPGDGHGVQNDLHLVSDPRQLGASLPAELAAMAPTLSGVVYEQTAAGRVPLASAAVELDGLFGLGLILASTRTDAEGRYLLCNVPQIRGLTIVAGLTGYELFYSSSELRGVATLDIDIRRRASP